MDVAVINGPWRCSKRQVLFFLLITYILTFILLLTMTLLTLILILLRAHPINLCAVLVCVLCRLKVAVRARLVLTIGIEVLTICPTIPLLQLLPRLSILVTALAVVVVLLAKTALMVIARRAEASDVEEPGVVLLVTDGRVGAWGAIALARVVCCAARISVHAKSICKRVKTYFFPPECSSLRRIDRADHSRRRD